MRHPAASASPSCLLLAAFTAAFTAVGCGSSDGGASASPADPGPGPGLFDTGAVDAVDDGGRSDGARALDTGVHADGAGPDAGRVDAADGGADGGAVADAPPVAVDPCGASTGATVRVPAGGDLQAAIDAAKPGDTLLLAAGATFTGNFVLPDKGPDPRCITLRSDAPDSALPAPGTRLGPSSAALLPRIVAASVMPAIATAPGAHHYRLLALELTVSPATYNFVIVALGAGDETALSQLPHDLVLDRVYVHGDPRSGAKRGVALNSINSWIVDSTIADIKGEGQDTQAIAGFNGPGPFRIVDDELEAAGENILFGGADPRIAGLVPSDIVIADNHLAKPLGWRVGDPGYVGTHWSVKNLFELKNAQRVTLDHNVLENVWPDAQNGYAIVLTPRNQEGTCPWCVVQDVTITHNVVRHAARAIGLLATDDTNPSLPEQRIVVRDNLFDDIGFSWGDGWFVTLASAYVTFDHNTIVSSGNAASWDSAPTEPGWVFTNNVVPHNEYGFHVDSGARLEAIFPGLIFQHNVVPGGSAAELPAGTANFFPATMADVGFRDAATRDYRLSATSAYRAAGTDGRDPGADFDALPAH